MRTTIESGSGLVLDLLQPEPAQISMTDIVHALAMQPRLLGAVSQRYSVAQHLLFVRELIYALRLPQWEKMFLQYFISHCHIPFVGDIPASARSLLAVQTQLAKLLSRIHVCVAQHVRAVYGVPENVLWTVCGIPAQVLSVVDAYENYHLLQGGGWSLQSQDDVSKNIKQFIEAAWHASSYRFSFDTPPQVQSEASVQSDLLRRIATACAVARNEEAAA